MDSLEHGEYRESGVLMLDAGCWMLDVWVWDIGLGVFLCESPVYSVHLCIIPIWEECFFNRKGRKDSKQRTLRNLTHLNVY